MPAPLVAGAPAGLRIVVVAVCLAGKLETPDLAEVSTAVASTSISVAAVELATVAADFVIVDFGEEQVATAVAAVDVDVDGAVGAGTGVVASPVAAAASAVSVDVWTEAATAVAERHEGRCWDGPLGRWASLLGQGMGWWIAAVDTPGRRLELNADVVRVVGWLLGRAVVRPLPLSLCRPGHVT